VTVLFLTWEITVVDENIIAFRRLRKVPGKKMLFGVCAGCAYAIGVPVWLIRILWVLTAFCGGFMAILYFLFAIFLPKWEKTPENFQDITGD
jgi:phage shock protein PspC (stress-responsive transcriptional regulator)